MEVYIVTGEGMIAQALKTRKRKKGAKSLIHCAAWRNPRQSLTYPAPGGILWPLGFQLRWKSEKELVNALIAKVT